MHFSLSVPDFQANTTKGDISFYDYLEKSKAKYAILFSHPKVRFGL